MGRPSKYTPELLAKAEQYLDIYPELGELIPTLAGMAVYCGICKQRVSEWRKDGDENKEPFRELCARVESEQELKLISGGLSRKYDSGLSKLLLMKHGYAEKTESDNKHDHTIKKSPPTIMFVDDPEPTEVDE